MPQYLERHHPRLTPQQAEIILTTSDVFGLWRYCKRAACRRRGACCGFAGANIPPCVPRLLAHFQVGFRAIGALLPDRRQAKSTLGQELDQQLLRMQKRLGDVLEQQIDALARSVEAESAGSSDARASAIES